MDDIECIVCGSVQVNPSILPCCHRSVCGSHISENCPLCRIPVNPEEVISNWLLISLMQKPRGFICERCEAVDSSSCCQECKMILCNNCYKSVHIGKYSSHSYTSLTSNENLEDVCRTHDIPFEYFCTEEWKSLCIECLDMHEDHPVLNISEAASQILFEIKNKKIRIEKIQEQVSFELDELQSKKSEVLYKYSSIVDLTKDSFQQVRHILSLKEQETLNLLESIKEKKLSDLDSTYTKLIKRSKQMENVVKMISTANLLPSNVILESMKYLTSLIQNSISSYESSLSSLNPNFVYPDFKSLFQNLENFSYNDESPQKLARRDSLTPLPSLRESRGSLLSNRGSSPMPFRVSTPTLALNTAENVLEQRKFVNKLQSNNAIKLSWTHSSGSVTYVLEYGIGSKTSGIEQFRQVYQGNSYNCLITDLLPKTTYRFRVCPLDENNSQGPWSEVLSVTTFEPQSIDESSLKNTATVVKRGDEKWIQFDKAGVIQATFPYTFGKYSWEVKVLSNNTYANDDNSGWIKVGVTPSKNKQVTGIVHNYLNVKQLKVNLLLDMDSQVLKVKTSENDNVEIFSLSESAQIPAFQYRPSKNSRNYVKIFVKFDEKPNLFG